jgi:amino acid adenylation domain-containing protein
MLEDSAAPFVVTHRGLGDRLGTYAGAIVDIDTALSGARASAPVVPVTDRDLAYVIYTSGSTGRPKGVLLEHRGLVNVALEQQRLFGAGPGSRVLQFASISFDAAVFDLAMALGSGATLHLAPPDAILPGAPLLRTLREQAITIVTLPPSALIATPDAELPALAVITVAGEACPAELVDRWAPGRRFFNLYGPTEATIWATATQCVSGGGTPSIGRPIANTEAFVLDGRGALAPIGVAGELHLGGAGLARAYHGRDDLTRASFVPHPFGPEGARLYKTGDRARLRADGELEFLGRLDAQVKVRGYRIELGEIDARLADLPGVEQAVTVVAGGALDSARLLAYVTPRAGASLAAHELRVALRARLPEFMVPSIVTVLDALPLTPSGKIDRARLPAAGETEAAETFVAPAPGLEAVIADVWKDVLGVPRVGVTDNFFDLGGTSLLIARVHARLETLAPGVFSMVDLFGLPTVQMLAARLAGAGSEAARPVDRRSTLAAGRARLAAAAGRRAAARDGRGSQS